MPKIGPWNFFKYFFIKGLHGKIFFRSHEVLGSEIKFFGQKYEKKLKKIFIDIKIFPPKFRYGHMTKRILFMSNREILKSQ